MQYTLYLLLTRKVVLKFGYIVLGLLVFFTEPWAQVAKQSDNQLDVARLEMALEQLSNGQYEQAVDIWEAMANNGHAQAQLSLASSYQYGLGRKQNDGLALKYYRLSAEQGDVRAMHQLALLYTNFKKTPVNLHQALFWWGKSAEAGYAPAQYYFGVANYIGLGVQQDKTAAQQWIAKSKVNGYDENGALLQLLKLKGANGKVELTAQASQSSRQHKIQIAGKPDLNIETKRSKKQQVAIKSDTPQAQEIPVYSEKADGTAPFTVIHDAWMIDIVEDHGKWLKIKYNNQFLLWVYGKFVDNKGEMGVVNAQNVRIRSAPSTNNTPLGTVNDGVKVRVIEIQGDWKKVTAPIDTTAWIKAKDLIKNNNAN